MNISKLDGYQKTPNHVSFSFHLLYSVSKDSKSKYFHRHTLNYLQEIGNGWFGKVRSPTHTSTLSCDVIM